MPFLSRLHLAVPVKGVFSVVSKKKKKNSISLGGLKAKCYWCSTTILYMNFMSDLKERELESGEHGGHIVFITVSFNCIFSGPLLC